MGYASIINLRLAIEPGAVIVFRNVSTAAGSGDVALNGMW
jgi:hypothetical protein